MTLACSKTFVQKLIPENHTQNRMWNSCLDIITKEIWRLNSSNFIPLDYLVWEIIRVTSIKGAVQNRRYLQTRANAANSLTRIRQTELYKFLKRLNACIVAKSRFFTIQGN